ncbi:MAG: hypothetical protein WCX86_01345 [Candidatus Hydrogenedentales bacterium]
MPKVFVGASLANDPHTEGLFKVQRIAKRAGIQCLILPPSPNLEPLLHAIKEVNPSHIGLSYRMSPEKGVDALASTLHILKTQGMLFQSASLPRKFGFAALPETIARVRSSAASFPVSLSLFSQTLSPFERMEGVLDYFDIHDDLRASILETLRSELFPKGIPELDQMAQYVLEGELYRDESPLPIPGSAAQRHLPTRMSESTLPLLRTHYGVPSNTIDATVEGIKTLAEARVIDEISLGSSDLSQRYFGNPEAFQNKKNDGGVPYKDADDLRQLFEATRRGNYPSIKPYAHVAGITEFIETCLQTGMLIGAHQAIPLFWFNELDGRGDMSLEESLHEHIAAVQVLAQKGIPVEMNDPNHWSSRWAHDTIIVTDYALITAVMNRCSVADMIFQFQLNKPVETGDFADLAKMTAALQLIDAFKGTAQVWRETRTGIEYFVPDPETSRFQLARATLLQMILAPHMIHLVSYCEASHAATADDIIESSQIVRRAARVFAQNKEVLLPYKEDEVVVDRREDLLREARYLLKQIAALDPNAAADTMDLSALANPTVLKRAVEKQYMSAPGLVHPNYPYPPFVTQPAAYGFFDVYAPDSKTPLTEKERLERLQG